VARDGWTYQFPSSSPTQSWQRSALVGVTSTSGAFTITRQGAGDLRVVKAPDGTSVEFGVNSMHRIISARESGGRTVHYEYDADGRLVHVQDSETGDEFYEYDPLNRLRAVLDATRRPRLLNTYGYSGDIRSQTLANGDTLSYEGVYSSSSGLVALKLTLPNGYTIDWSLTSDGYSQSWPQAPTHN
jgi:YD repeat-containing protein